MNLDVRLTATAEAEVEYGEYRRTVAALYQIEPEQVTAAHIREYEQMTEDE